jgi:hypothetical protein
MENSLIEVERIQGHAYGLLFREREKIYDLVHSYIARRPKPPRMIKVEPRYDDVFFEGTAQLDKLWSDDDDMGPLG